MKIMSAHSSNEKHNNNNSALNWSRVKSQSATGDIEVMSLHGGQPCPVGRLQHLADVHVGLNFCG